jgi:hypothetical protein
VTLGGPRQKRSETSWGSSSVVNRARLFCGSEASAVFPSGRPLIVAVLLVCVRLLEEHKLQNHYILHDVGVLPTSPMERETVHTCSCQAPSITHGIFVASAGCSAVRSCPDSCRRRISPHRHEFCGRDRLHYTVRHVVYSHRCSAGARRSLPRIEQLGGEFFTPDDVVPRPAQRRVLDKARGSGTMEVCASLKLPAAKAWAKALGGGENQSQLLSGIGRPSTTRWTSAARSMRQGAWSARGESSPRPLPTRGGQALGGFGALHTLMARGGGSHAAHGRAHIGFVE